jgi:hypothetical protein
LNREQQQAVMRYEAWQKLREKAINNAGGKLPEGYTEIPHAPPPPPPVVDDADIMDLSMELSAASIEDVPGDLDERGIERVPMADPVAEVGLIDEISCWSSAHRNLAAIPGVTPERTFAIRAWPTCAQKKRPPGYETCR